ncbi:MAG: hypothetical protein CVU13_09870 [Bacteroidetes bacterium HGW-Bacteroidetes-8]|jgi:hypothetical protein|nr:MAG: hypothetical protein CVU13_09870 [Bacteroidetes bacterium HGW-Bacteroidetes-8]
MTKKFIFFVSLLIAVLIQSCDSNPNVTASKIPMIDLESAVGSGKVFNLSDVATEIRYIPLETKKESLISNVNKIYFENDRIYLFTNNNIVIFDSNGKHLLTFDRRGNGPQEYNYISSNDVDPHNSNILLHAFCSDQTASILTYSPEGTLLSRYLSDSIQNVLNTKFFKLDDNKFIIKYPISIVDSVEAYAKVFDSSGTVVKRLYKPKLDYYKKKYDRLIELSGKNGVMFALEKNYRVYPLAYRYKEFLRFFFYENDTIFSIDRSLNYSPVYVVNFGKYKNPEEFDGHYSKGDHISLERGICYETDNFILMEFNLRSFAHEPLETVSPNGKGSSKNTKSFALYDKNSGELTLMNTPMPAKPGFKEDFESGPPFFPSCLSSEMYAISIIYPDKLKSFAQSNPVSPKLKSIANNLNEFDNPVVVLVKMK